MGSLKTIQSLHPKHPLRIEIQSKTTNITTQGKQIVYIINHIYLDRISPKNKILIT